MEALPVLMQTCGRSATLHPFSVFKWVLILMERLHHCSVPVLLSNNRNCIPVPVQCSGWGAGLSVPVKHRESDLDYSHESVIVSRLYLHRYLRAQACKTNTSTQNRLVKVIIVHQLINPVVEITKLEQTNSILLTSLGIYLLNWVFSKGAISIINLFFSCTINDIFGLFCMYKIEKLSQ